MPGRSEASAATRNGAGDNAQRVWRLLETVSDPEIPVLSVLDLGIVRDVSVCDDGVEVTITPTYSGCPAMNVIEVEVLKALHQNGFPDARVKTVLSPPWTTDWLSEAGREKLKQFGIAPPSRATTSKRALFADAGVIACPRCGSESTQRVSEFGSTPCKALYRCDECHEPFDYFKCI